MQDGVQVYGFRQTLFEEHLGEAAACFADPGSLECMREVRRRADASWRAFAAEEVQPLPCHLMPYPFQVICVSTTHCAGSCLRCGYCICIADKPRSKPSKWLA